MNDFHTHTTASDGALSPEQLLERALQNGVKRLAITDHDTVAGYLSVCDSEQAKQLQLISGVEISTTWNGIGIHIVGLHFDAKHPAMTTLLLQQSKSREARAKQILQRLAKHNMPITMEEMRENIHTHQIGRPHIAQVMVKKGYINNTNAAFKKYLGAGKIGDVKSGWCDMQLAVETIIDSGGIAVVAHPDHYKMTRTKQVKLLDEFKSAGGQAIEVISGKQHRDMTEKYAQIAHDKGFYASLGSDFHQRLPYAADVGELTALPEMVRPIWLQFSR